MNRAQIVDDVLNLARARVVTYTRAIDVISYLVNETEYYPWYSALTGLSYVKRRIGDEDSLRQLFEVELIASSTSLMIDITLFQAFVSSILTDVLDTVPFSDNNTDHLFTLKRNLLLTWACELNIGDCVSRAQEAFEKYKTEGVR